MKEEKARNKEELNNSKFNRGGKNALAKLFGSLEFGEAPEELKKEAEKEVLKKSKD